MKRKEMGETVLDKSLDRHIWRETKDKKRVQLGRKRGGGCGLVFGSHSLSCISSWSKVENVIKCPRRRLVSDNGAYKQLIIFPPSHVAVVIIVRPRLLIVMTTRSSGILNW